MDTDSSAGSGRRPRRYHSPVRSRRAADTRRRIATAARELFVEHGFGGTTVDAIASRSGVTAQTVYATFRTKGAIVAALLTQLEDDAEAATWQLRIAEQTDPAGTLTAFAEWTAAFFSHSRALIPVVRDASGDPALAELGRQGDQHRRAALRTLLDGLSRRGALRAGLQLERAVDAAWMLTGLQLYLSATEDCGWSDQEYAAWLARLLRSQLLPPLTRDDAVR